MHSINPLHRRPLRSLAMALALFLPLLSTACATSSTRALRARTERPDLPPRPSELTRTERLRPLTAVPGADDEMRISRAVLRELYERLADAIGAVERGNNRIVGNNRLWACTEAVWRTGKTPEGCAAER